MNIWKLETTLLNNQWIKEEVKGKIKLYLEINEKANITYESLWDTAKTVLRRKFRLISAFIKKFIDKYDPIAIYFIVLGSCLYTLFVFSV